MNLRRLTEIGQPERRLSPDEHAALEALDMIQAELSHASFTREIAQRLREAIDATETAMRGGERVQS